MPFIPNIAITQSLANPGQITLQDTSTGSDVLINSRRVEIETNQGTYLVEDGTTTDYEVWPYADSSIVLDVLDGDYAPSITVEWLSVAGAVLYTFTDTYIFNANAKNFLYTLTQNQSSDPSITNDTNYYNNKMKLFTEVKSAENAITIGNDINSAQEALDRAASMIENEAEFF